MKMNMKKEEIVQQILYALLGLAFIATLFASTQARSADTTILSKGDQITMTGEITSIEGDGFALKHENGITLVGLKKIEKKAKDALQTADVIKVGNRVTVSGEMEKGSFNNPVIMAESILVEQTAPPPAVQVVPTPVVPTPVTPTAVPTPPTVTVVPPAE